MPVFNDELGNIFHTDGDRIVWATTRRPALLLPDQKIIIDPFTVQFPDFVKNNAYGFAVDTTTSQSTCMSMVTIVPQEWDSGLSELATLSEQFNYFETEITLTRIKTPSNFMQLPFPDCWGSGTTHMCDGGALMEATGMLVRIFTIERDGDKICLRRKQSVTNGGARFVWNSNNNNDTAAGGMRNGWTHGGNPNGWVAAQIDYKAGGNIQKRRGGSNACSLSDPTDYESIWRGKLVITPGYIKP
ncbi:MAG: hypothetical protein P0Y65_05880 [Candidatus Devosia phytovorans]|uniref:Uncharacterized protein n=1 Tax=Candidatus Devosia phytovorans TaxID=3121372 RepID=A0AAJ5VX28_9HYPH|nr:hypothetical protein [Devosia sp.]WEK05785.1 MAG: hypothetical protein P0Y65_05880 [Devosia sp.]